MVFESIEANISMSVKNYLDSIPTNEIYLAYLDKEDCNVITVDWEILALFPLYVRAVTYTNIVGEHTGDFINFLVDQGAKLEDFHVIGFSLGAHVAGKAGATVNGLLPRITGTN